MRVWPLALMFGGGCAQLFGLDETTSAPDANPGDVSLAVQRVSIGSTVVKAPQDLTGQMATFYVDDGTGNFTTTQGTLVPPNKFTAPIMMGTPPVQFTLPDDMVPYFFASSRAQIVNNVVFERPGMMPAADTSKIAVSIALPSAYASGEAFNVLAVGPWTQHPLAAGELPAPDMGTTTIDSPAIDYTTYANVSSAMMNAKITAADFVLVLRTVGARLTGYLETQFDQTDATDTITGTMNAVTEDKTLNAAIDPAAFAMRFMAVQPAVTGQSLSYSIVAAPGADFGQARGIQLRAGISNAMDTMVTVPYGNPFTSHGWKSLLTFSTTSSRTFTYMTATVPLAATMQSVTDPATTSTLPMPAGLPTAVTANGTSLITDGMDVPLDLTKPVTIAATVDKTTMATYYSLGISEITVSGTTATRATVLNAVSSNATFTIPQSTFKVGHAYVIQFATHEGGYPNADAGDFANFMLPYATASLDSALFTVVAP